MEHLRLTASEFYMILPLKTEKNVIAISNELRLTLNLSNLSNATDNNWRSSRGSGLMGTSVLMYLKITKKHF